MVVLFALAVVGALVGVLRGRRKRSGQLNVLGSYHGQTKAGDRLTRLPDKKPSAAPTVEYLPNLHGLRIHTLSEGSNSNGADTRMMSLEDVRLTPRIAFPRPKGGGCEKGGLNI
jgi:hypothetical protein